MNKTIILGSAAVVALAAGLYFSTNTVEVKNTELSFESSLNDLTPAAGDEFGYEDVLDATGEAAEATGEAVQGAVEAVEEKVEEVVEGEMKILPVDEATEEDHSDHDHSAE